jgi:outer membrane protein assembly factor BamD (BamD/ComL family)
MRLRKLLAKDEMLALRFHRAVALRFHRPVALRLHRPGALRLLRQLTLLAFAALSAGCAAWGPPRQTFEQPAAVAPTSSSRVVRNQGDDEGLFPNMPDFEDFTPSAIFNRTREYTPWRRDEQRAQGRLQAGDELFRQKKYGEAAAEYKSAAFYWPDSIIEEDALFKLAECQFFSDRYPKATDTYAKLLKKYNNSRHLDTVVRRQFAMARYWQELQRVKPKNFASPNVTDKTRPIFNTSGNALASFESVRLNDAAGPLADDSIMATANAYFLEEKFDDADYYYGLIRSEYPQSEHLPQACVLGLRAKLRTYQGAVYDDTPLVDSKELVSQMLTQFPQELGDERERLQQAQLEIEAQIAYRDWKMGEFYDRRSYYRAASYYYEKIIREHPDTRFSAQAQRRLNEIKDLPPEPPQRLKWLADMLTSEDR